MVISGHTKLMCVIGHPVAHSLSPQLHCGFAERTGVDAVYLAFDVTAYTLPAFIAAAKTLPIIGFNVTMPLKTEIIRHLDHIDPIAEQCGAVNTVVNRGGELTGFNTDGEGLIASLCDANGEVRKEKGELSDSDHSPLATLHSPLVLGNGGAAKAAAAALRLQGCDVAMLSVRTDGARLCELAPSADLIVNATPLGMSGYAQFDDFSFLDNTNALIYDFVYNPRETMLLAEAKRRGLRTLDGVALLTRQAELAFEKFTGVSVR